MSAFPLDFHFRSQKRAKMEVMTQRHKDSNLIFRIFLFCRMVSFSCTLQFQIIFSPRYCSICGTVNSLVQIVLISYQF